MHSDPTIQYDAAKLARQWPIIAKSRLDALKKVFGHPRAEVLGLSKDDPPELWQFVIGRSERRPEFTKVEKEKAKAIAERVRQLDPEITVTQETDKEFRDNLGTPTLRETAQRLAYRLQDDNELAKHLAKLLALYKRKPVTQKDDDQNAIHAGDATSRLLIWNWIQDPPRENWAIASFCFFSDRAMAKMIYYLRKKQWMPAELQNKEPERIRKLYGSLGLTPARPRAIKDVEFRAGKIHFVLFKTATPKGR